MFLEVVEEKVISQKWLYVLTHILWLSLAKTCQLDALDPYFYQQDILLYWYKHSPLPGPYV
jgi:hypothetical protein